MKHLPQSHEQRASNLATYELSDGRTIELDPRDHRNATEAEIRAAYELDDPTDPIAVMQAGRRVGTVPADFHPKGFEPLTSLYDARPGDFREKDGVWIAANALGHGDFAAIPGFQFHYRDET